MSKALRIKIIDYLRRNDATARYIDIKAHILNEKDSVAQRNELKATLDYLANNKLIAINGSYEFLHWTMTNGLYNLNNKVIAAKLTHNGQSYHPENGADEMELAVQPVLAVIRKNAEARGDDVLSSHGIQETAIAEETETTNYPVDEPVSFEPIIPAEPKYYEPDEVSLPWYEETKPEEAIEDKLPWYNETKPEEAIEDKLPWYNETKPEEVVEDKLPWYNETKPEEPQISQAPVEEMPQPVIHKFPPIEYKSESITKPPSPMVIEMLNENLSQSIDAISNLKIRKPARLTGDFERDVNVILKFILVIVLFLFFACIVWLYMG